MRPWVFWFLPCFLVYKIFDWINKGAKHGLVYMNCLAKALTIISYKSLVCALVYKIFDWMNKGANQGLVYMNCLAKALTIIHYKSLVYKIFDWMNKGAKQGLVYWIVWLKPWQLLVKSPWFALLFVKYLTEWTKTQTRDLYI